jgi:hypothetical protein
MSVSKRKETGSYTLKTWGEYEFAQRHYDPFWVKKTVHNFISGYSAVRLFWKDLNKDIEKVGIWLLSNFPGAFPDFKKLVYNTKACLRYNPWDKVRPLVTNEYKWLDSILSEMVKCHVPGVYQRELAWEGTT